MKKIIDVNGFVKEFGKFTAVDNISFHVEAGSIFAFLGPNGAGKSTTINTLCTISEKTAGKLIIDGKDISKEKDAVRQSIGVVFQEPTLDQKMSVEENLNMHCHFYNLPRSKVNERIDFVLELVDLTDWRKAMITSLSGGMKRRVEIARSLLHFPKVLFLDEPTTGLDPQTRSNIWEYITKLQKENNMTIFLTTHYMEEAEICDTVAVIDHGKIIAFDNPDTLKKRYTKDTVTIMSSEPEDLVQLLKDHQLDFIRKSDLFSFEVNDTSTVLSIISDHEVAIKEIEIKKGTLNDVFLAITGRDIREGV